MRERGASQARLDLFCSHSKTALGGQALKTRFAAELRQCVIDDVPGRFVTDEVVCLGHTFNPTHDGAGRNANDFRIAGVLGIDMGAAL